MKHWRCRLAVVVLMSVTRWVQAAITCGMAVSNVYPIYNPLDNNDADAVGTVTLTCARTAGEASTPYWIGSSWVSGSTLRRQAGPQTLTYRLFRNSSFSGNWTMTSGISGTLVFWGATASITRNYYFRIPRSNFGQPAGLYDTTIQLTQRFSPSGANQSTATLVPVASIVAECRISSAPGPLVLNYASFSPGAVTASTSFAVSCTKGTPYTVALDATSGILLGLNYSLALNASSGTGIALPQSYVITGTIAANQSGSCATAACNGTRVHTVTITY